MSQPKHSYYFSQFVCLTFQLYPPYPIPSRQLNFIADSFIPEIYKECQAIILIMYVTKVIRGRKVDLDLELINWLVKVKCIFTINRVDFANYTVDFANKAQQIELCIILYKKLPSYRILKLCQSMIS